MRLVSEQPVEVAAATITQPAAETTGTFVDARDRSDCTLARVAAPHAFTTSVEVFPEAPGEPITRTDVAQPKGAFTVVVPTPDETDHATIVSVARARGANLGHRIRPGQLSVASRPIAPRRSLYEHR